MLVSVLCGTIFGAPWPAHISPHSTLTTAYFSSSITCKRSLGWCLGASLSAMLVSVLFGTSFWDPAPAQLFPHTLTMAYSGSSIAREGQLFWLVGAFLPAIVPRAYSRQRQSHVASCRAFKQLHIWLVRIDQHPSRPIDPSAPGACVSAHFWDDRSANG